MNIGITIAILLVAVAIVGVGFYLAQTLNATRKTLDSVTSTLEGLQEQIEGITTETTLLLQKTNDLAEDVNHKVAKLNSVFDGVEEVGDTFNSLTRSMKRLSSSIAITSDEDLEKATEAVKWSSTLLNIWKNRKNK